MKKIILFAALALMAIAFWGQEQLPVQADEQTQAQVEEAPPATPVLTPIYDLKRIRIPRAFIHEGKEYPAGAYWMTLAKKDGQILFTVQNGQKETLFEELAIVKPKTKGGGSSFHVDINGMKDGEYARVKISAPNEWMLAYFLLKK
jgi:hypothetical protein